jgi:hypothetical protein
MYQYLYEESFDSFTAGELHFFQLRFAADTVLILYSKEELQKLLNNLHSYCCNGGISVNIGKTVVMVCKKGNRYIFYD